MTEMLLPQLGSVALQAGRWAAENIVADHAGQAPAGRSTYKDKGIMAMIGDGAAVAEMGAHHHEAHGHLAFAAWLGVHAWLMSGVRQRIDAFVSRAGLPRSTIDVDHLRAFLDAAEIGCGDDADERTPRATTPALRQARRGTRRDFDRDRPVRRRRRAGQGHRPASTFPVAILRHPGRTHLLGSQDAHCSSGSASATPSPALGLLGGRFGAKRVYLAGIAASLVSMGLLVTSAEVDG